jgi:hypothetical protein
VNTNLKNKVALISAPVLVLSSMASQAALDAGISTGITSIQADALSLVALVWPVVLAVTGAFIVFKLFKRSISKI